MAQRRATVIRSGGLGDFIVTIPFLQTLATCYDSLTLITRSSYRELLGNAAGSVGFIDIDSRDFSTLFSGIPAKAIRSALAGSTVYSFFRDEDCELERLLAAAGANQLVFLDPRPAAPPHVTTRMFSAARIPPPAHLLHRSCLARQQVPPRGVLWLHPGSGSPNKNAPVGRFATEAKDWLRRSNRGCAVSIGEADEALLQPMREALRDLPVEWVVNPPLGELRRQLEENAASYVGNDTGVTHLAATLGIETKALFTSTDPEIWRPLGEAVSVEMV